MSRPHRVASVSVLCVICAAVLIALSCLRLVTVPGSETETQVVAGCGLVLCSFVAIRTFLDESASPCPLTKRYKYPFVSFVALYNGLAYFVPVFFERASTRIWGVSFRGTSSEAVVIALVGVTSLFVGVYLCNNKVSLPQVIARRQIPAQVFDGLLVLIAFANIVGAVADVPIVGSTLKSIAVAMSPISLAILMYRAVSLGNRYARIYTFGLVLPICFLVGAASGLLSRMQEPATVAIFVYWMHPGRRLVRIIVGATIIVGLIVPLNTIKRDYRAQYWNSVSESSIDERLRSLASSLTSFISTGIGSEGQTPTDSVEDMIVRVSAVGFLSDAVERVPATVDYFGGASYLNLLYAFVPRLLYPDKPSELWGGEVSGKLGLRSEGDDTTSFNVPWLVEAYVNFGVIGIVLVMGTLGFILRTVDRTFNDASGNVVVQLVGVGLLQSLTWQESNVSLMFGSRLVCLLGSTILLVAFEGTRKSDVGPGRGFSMLQEGRL